jgi:hypothetical protein
MNNKKKKKKKQQDKMIHYMHRKKASMTVDFLIGNDVSRKIMRQQIKILTKKSIICLETYTLKKYFSTTDYR